MNEYIESITYYILFDGYWGWEYCNYAYKVFQFFIIIF